MGGTCDVVFLNVLAGSLTRGCYCYAVALLFCVSMPPRWHPRFIDSFHHLSGCGAWLQGPWLAQVLMKYLDPKIINNIKTYRKIMKHI